MKVRHSDEARKITIQWDLGEELTLLLVTQGPPARKTSMCLHPHNAAATIKAGIGLRWPTGDKPSFGVICYIEQLVRVGCIKPVRLGIRSQMIGYALEALADHWQVVHYADSIVDREQHLDVVELYEIGLPLKASEQTVFTSKKGENAIETPPGIGASANQRFDQRVYHQHLPVR